MTTTARGVHLGILTVLLSALLTVALSLSASAGLLPTALENLAATLTACPFETATGSPCPLCGTTTAAGHLLQGRWKESRGANPLGLFLAPMLVIQLIYRAYRLYRPRLIIKEEALCLIGPALAGGILLLLAP